jgi:hypothetical protein
LIVGLYKVDISTFFYSYFLVSLKPKTFLASQLLLASLLCCLVAFLLLLASLLLLAYLLAKVSAVALL